MSATNKTTNYDLPVFVGTDKPSWLGDWNSAMTAIDTAIAGGKSTGDSATTVAGQAKSTAEAASETATAASETAAAASDVANSAVTIANNANTQAGDAKTDAHAALKMTTGLQEKFSGNRSSTFEQLYPNLVKPTDYWGYLLVVSSNYNLSIKGYVDLTATGWQKVTKIATGTTYYFLIGVVPGNPFGLTGTTNLSPAVYLGSTLGLKHKTTEPNYQPMNNAIYMIYNSSTQRTEIYIDSVLKTDDETAFPENVDLFRYFTNVTYIDNDIEVPGVL